MSNVTTFALVLVPSFVMKILEEICFSFASNVFVSTFVF